MINKRGQAAMEFLMTYGWALLVVLVAIGALAFFGVLNPGQFLPSTCTITPGLACNDFQVLDTNDAMSVVIQNGFGDDLTGVIVGFDTDSDPTTIECTGTPVDDNVLSDGEEDTWSATTCGTFNVGGKVKAGIHVTYITSGGLTHTKIGQMVTQVE